MKHRYVAIRMQCLFGNKSDNNEWPRTVSIVEMKGFFNTLLPSLVSKQTLEARSQHHNTK